MKFGRVEIQKYHVVQSGNDNIGGLDISVDNVLFFTENQCICTLRQSKYDMQQTAYEFANYVLSSTVQKEGT